jgi:hypothetical protein
MRTIQALELPELPGFTVPTSVDELQLAISIFSETDRVALMNEKPLVMWNKDAKAVAILRPDNDGSWNVEVVEKEVTE